MATFVILRHEMPAGHPRAAHFDLMLERSGALWTWAIERLPAVGETLTADRLADHRLAYLDYEGEIAGGRGSVRRVERGDYEVLEESAGKLVIRLRGTKLEGDLTLVAKSDESNGWEITFREP